MIKWNEEKLRIRPSSIDGFFTCPYQWAKVFLEGVKSIPGARAAIGTAIHAGAEVLWTDAILTGEKDINRTKLHDACIAEFQELDKEGLQYDSGEDNNTAEATILGGMDCFIEDIVPFTDIPQAVEQRFTIPLDHIMVEDLSGTVDYISKDTIADVKTSKRKPIPTSYVTQQSIYKMLAQANGVDVQYNTIQGVVLKKVPEGHTMEMPTDIPKAKILVNMILDTLDVFHQDIVAPEVLFRPNTKHYLCSPKYCALYGKTCPATGGTAKPTQVAVKM